MPAITAPPPPTDTELLAKHRLYVPEFVLQLFPKPAGYSQKEHHRFNEAFLKRIEETGCYRTLGGQKVMTAGDIDDFMDAIKAGRPGYDGIEPANPTDDSPGTISVYGDFANPETPVCVLWAPWGHEATSRRRLEAISPEPLPDMRSFPASFGQAATFRQRMKRHQYRGYWYMQRSAFWDAFKADFDPPNPDDDDDDAQDAAESGTE